MRLDSISAANETNMILHRPDHVAKILFDIGVLSHDAYQGRHKLGSLHRGVIKADIGVLIDNFWDIHDHLQAHGYEPFSTYKALTVHVMMGVLLGYAKTDNSVLNGGANILKMLPTNLQTKVLNSMENTKRIFGIQ